LDTTSEVSPEVSPDLPHICREKRKHEINTQNLPMKKREIDFSTRNLQAEILSQHTPWVGTLTQVHKNIMSDKKCIDSDIINQVHTVTVTLTVFRHKRLSKYNIRTTIQNSRTKVDIKHNIYRYHG
jgi:hypothetical protein